jgi:HEAT repeat protein
MAMKYAHLFCCVLGLLLCSFGAADSPLRVPKTLVKPRLLWEPTPPEAIWVHYIAHTAPRLLLQYIDPEEYYNPSSTVYPSWADSRRCRNYAVLVLGDVGGPDLIPALLQFADRYRQGKPRQYNVYGIPLDYLVHYEPDRQVAFVLELTAERIRYRMMGREAYVQEMIRWLRTPEPAPGKGELEYLDRVVQAARALATIRAREAVPVLLQLHETPRWYAGAPAMYLLRPLARIGDKRAMPALELELSRMPPYARDLGNALEVGELDPLLVYWLMRTDDMSLEQATQELLRSAAQQSSWLRQEQVIEDYIGPAAIPQLLQALSDPPAGENQPVAQGIAAQLLGKWRVREAVPELRKLLRTGVWPCLRGDAAKALGRIGAREALDDLIDVATHAEHYMARNGAIDALGLLGDARAEPALLRLAAHPHPSTRFVALEALRTCATEASLAALRQLWEEEKDENLKAMAEWVIKEVLRKERR